MLRGNIFDDLSERHSNYLRFKVKLSGPYIKLGTSQVYSTLTPSNNMVLKTFQWLLWCFFLQFNCWFLFYFSLNNFLFNSFSLKLSEMQQFILVKIQEICIIYNFQIEINKRLNFILFSQVFISIQS